MENTTSQSDVYATMRDAFALFAITRYPFPRKDGRPLAPISNLGDAGYSYFTRAIDASLISEFPAPAPRKPDKKVRMVNLTQSGVFEQWFGADKVGLLDGVKQLPTGERVLSISSAGLFAIAALFADIATESNWREHKANAIISAMWLEAASYALNIAAQMMEE